MWKERKQITEIHLRQVDAEELDVRMRWRDLKQVHKMLLKRVIKRRHQRIADQVLRPVQPEETMLPLRDAEDCAYTDSTADTEIMSVQ